MTPCEPCNRPLLYRRKSSPLRVHRFLRTGIDEDGMPVTETDHDYGALSLALREGTEPDAVVERLFERNMVVLHASEAEAVAAIAADVAPTSSARAPWRSPWPPTPRPRR